MKKRLSKIARDLNVNISDVSEFLRANGYDCDENPNEELSIEAVDIIRYNFPAFFTEKKKQSLLKTPTSKKLKPAISESSEQIPLELKIIEAASKEKKLIERIIGFTEFDWNYIVAKYNGECSQPVEFNLFDEVLCDLLLTEQMSSVSIGNILGFDIERDPAEREIILSAINELRKDKMIEGDESILWLTDLGRDYASNGVKFSTFQRNFELYFDLIGEGIENPKSIFSKLKSEKKQSLTFSEKSFRILDVAKSLNTRSDEIAKIIFDKTGKIINEKEQFNGHLTFQELKLIYDFFQIPLPPDLLIQHRLYDIDEIKAIAELQAPEIHYPTKNFLLQSVDFLGAESMKSKVWVVLLENFRDNSLRTIVYDEKQDIVIDELSNVLNKNEKIKSELLEQLIKVDDEIEYTTELKPEDQLEIENELIQKQVEFDLAIDNNQIEKVKQIKKEVESIKRHFNSLEFEVELKRLFDETADELWIISPWIKNATFKRIPFFEKYLKKNGRIFVAYSEPEEEGQIMALEEPLKKLFELERNYPNFYLHQLSPFHYKNVWLRRETSDNVYYTGSYNILSFFVSQGLQKVRQEKMSRFDWDDEVQEEFEDVHLHFGLKYANKAIEDFNTLCQKPPALIDREYLQKIRTFNLNKLNPFVGKGHSIIDEKFSDLENLKADNLNYYRKIYFVNRLKEFAKEVLDLSAKPISYDRKRNLLNEFDKTRNEFLDFHDLQQTSVKDIVESINKLVTFNFQKQSQFNKKQIR
jgi:hypothetical protein